MPASADRLDLHTVYETSGILSSLDLAEVLRNLLLVAMSRLLTGRGVVLLEDVEQRGFRVALARGIPAKDALAPGTHLPCAIQPDETLHDDAVPPAFHHCGLRLLLPITHHRQVIGLLGLGGKLTGQPYERDEVAFVRSLVNMSAAAVYNARVAEELKTTNQALAARVQELNTLFELSKAFGEALDVDRAARLLSLTLMGQLLVRQHDVLRRHDDGHLETLVAGGPKRLLDAATLARLAHLDAPLHVPTDGDWAALYAAGHRLAVPVQRREDGTPGGVLCLGARATGQPFGPNDEAFLTALGTLALTAIENALLVESRIEKERLEEELRLARSIQERLLPAHLPHVDGLDLAALALPSRFVAGDYYECFGLDDGHLLLSIADVSGKGMAAALLMANLQACIQLLRGSARTVGDLAATTARINAVICRNTNASSFITFFWGFYDPRSRRLRYVNAGHNPPFLLRANGQLDQLETGGLVLGVLRSAQFEQGEVAVDPGDTLLLFTDGVTEARGDDTDDYGEERLAALLRAHADADAPHLLNALRESIRTHTADAPLSDDLTALVVRVTG